MGQRDKGQRGKGQRKSVKNTFPLSLVLRNIIVDGPSPSMHYVLLFTDNLKPFLSSKAPGLDRAI